MSNFDFLTKQVLFKSFASAAVNAEKCLSIDPSLAITQCRRALELAVNWMYNVDDELSKPEGADLCELMNNFRFRKIIGESLSRNLNLIRKAGNQATHSQRIFNQETALLVLNTLFVFFDWINQNYGDDQTPHSFSRENAINAGNSQVTESKELVISYEEKIQALTAQNLNLQKQNEVLSKITNQQKEQLTASRKENSQNYKEPKSPPRTEAQTRAYIDILLADAGWIKGVDWKEEVLVEGMPNASGMGFQDYVLYDDDGKPLAIVEAKREGVPVETGREQAKIYADNMKKKYGVRPVIFTSNGSSIHILYDENYPEREISSFYSKSDLQFLAYRNTHKQPLSDYNLNDICERYYQKEAINSVCEHFSKNYRKALLVMATGSGKTRTILGLIKVLAEKNWIKNVLFLADRTSLVSQAYSAAKTYLKSQTLANLCESKKEDRDPKARIVFSTYQTMISTIDSVFEDGKRLFTSGHFSLIICDEAHRSIYNKYKEIFRYFDSLLVGLTATPKNEIDKNTYQEFGLEIGDPTYYYPLETAVNDGYLVDFHTIKFNTDFMLNGIKYSNLSDEDKERWDEAFADDEGHYVEEVNSGAINKWLFSRDTIRKVINALMDYGLKIECGDKIGKTIIFARNHKHAEEIVKVFNQEYPYYGGEFCQVIDNQIKFHDILIDKFKNPHNDPQIAVSVDMLDTGIDVPECLNLVFFKPVYSYAKFWQMIGRGTRKCENLIDGEDKKYFVIIDACKNFDFFEENPHGLDGKLQISLEHRTFVIRTKILKALTDNGKFDSKEYCDETVKALTGKVREINQETFMAKTHLGAIRKYSNEDSFKHLSDEIIEDLNSQIGELLVPSEDDIRSRRFDNLLYGIELSYISGNNKEFNRLISNLKKIATILLDKVGNSIDAVKKNRSLLERLLKDEFVQSMTLKEFENTRKQLRELVVYIENDISGKDIYIDVEDNISNVESVESGVSRYADTIAFEPYKNRVERYVREHINEGVIYKIHNNQKLSSEDIKELEDIVWNKIGTKDEYEANYPKKNIGVFIRQISGLDKIAAKEAFSKFLDNHNLTTEQSAFINLVINYVVQNGLIEENNILLEKPFDQFKLFDVFSDTTLFTELLSSIKAVTENAEIKV